MNKFPTEEDLIPITLQFRTYNYSHEILFYLDLEVGLIINLFRKEMNDILRI